MNLRRLGLGAAFALTATMFAGTAEAQLRDITQISPTVPGGAINKSFVQEIGAGRGSIFMPDTSRFIINRDPFRAIRRGRQLFQRKFTDCAGQSGRRTNDGIGNPSFIGGDPSITAGFADSCAACHGRPRGSAGHGGDVVTRPDSRDAPHLFGLGLQEQLADEMTTALRAIRAEAINQAVTNEARGDAAAVAKGVNFGSITANPDSTVNTSAVVGVDPDLRVRPFFAQGLTISIREFAIGAFNAEMGLEGFDNDLILAAGGADVADAVGHVAERQHRQDRDRARRRLHRRRRSGRGGRRDPARASPTSWSSTCCTTSRRGRRSRRPNSSAVTMGRATFTSIGCTTCHRPTFTIASDRRVADLETNFSDFNPAMPMTSGNPFNRMFAVATAFVTETADVPDLPTLKRHSNHSFVVRNIFTDFKRHDLGLNFHERNYEGTLSTLFITEPLWGVGTTAPYGHDGRSDDAARTSSSVTAARRRRRAMPSRR